MNEWLWLIVAVVVTFLLLSTLHWMPQRKLFGRITRYISGVSCLFVGYALWRLPLGDWQTPIGMAVIIIAGGLAVIGAYEWDEITKNGRKVKKIEAINESLKDKR